MEISGVIRSGVGKGAYFTQLDWVIEQCKNILGYRPFPGTLNVYIDDGDLHKLPQFFGKTDFQLVPTDPAFCSARIKKVTIEGIPAAVVIPSADVLIHESRVIEVIAASNLKVSLGLEDGNKVTISGG